MTRSTRWPRDDPDRLRPHPGPARGRAARAAVRYPARDGAALGLVDHRAHGLRAPGDPAARDRPDALDARHAEDRSRAAEAEAEAQGRLPEATGGDDAALQGARRQSDRQL